MSQAIVDGQRGESKREIGSIETEESNLEARTFYFPNGPNASDLPGSRCVIDLAPGGASSGHSPRQPFGNASETKMEHSPKPLLIDLFAGLFGWSVPAVEEGWRVLAFDIEDMHANFGLPKPDGIQLILQDVRTLHGSQFARASLIVASSPCQEFSYRAMPWKRAKALGPPLLGMELFAQAERIQREAIAAAGRFIPMVQENVRGAQPFVGRARWHYGSFYLWGDVPALMPITVGRTVMKQGITHRQNGATNFHGHDATKVGGPRGDDWFTHHNRPESGKGQNPDGRLGNNARDAFVRDEIKRPDGGEGSWFGNYAEQKARGTISPGRMSGSKSSARKAASARIAKIPFRLAQHIAKVWKPREKG